MSRILKLLILWCCCCYKAIDGVICFNCTATQAKVNECAGDFAPPYLPFNATNKLLTNCSGDNAMCFVRSWRARSRHAWIVQRGCYQSFRDDPIPHMMTKPTRAMSCTKRRLIEAEYKVCLCRANWCNSACLNSMSIKITSILNSIIVYFNLMFKSSP